MSRGFLYLNGMWREEKGKLVATVKCENFMDAIERVNQIAKLAEEVNHHPDLRIYSYKILEIELFTHSQNGITEMDHLLAQKITALFN